MSDKAGGRRSERLRPRSIWAGVLLFAALGFACCTQVSCKANIETTRHLGTCTTCGGSGMFGRGRCPTCLGIGFTKVSYSYPVIAPGKTYPDDR